MKDEYIVMKVSDLRLLLNDIKRFKHYYIYASDQNRDGQGEWHCDIEVGDEPLGEDGWGDGEEHHSFDSLENHLAKFGQTSLSSVRSLFLPACLPFCRPESPSKPCLVVMTMIMVPLMPEMRVRAVEWHLCYAYLR